MNHFARRKLRSLEVASFDHGGQSFAPHFHDEFVISVNVLGHERIRLDGATLQAAPGDITLYNPAQVQSSDIVSGDWRFLSLYVAPGQLAAACGLSPETVFDTPLLKHAGIARHAQDALQMALDPDVSEQQAEERLILVLDELLAVAGSRHASASRHVPDAIARVADRLDAERSLPSLSQLAQDAGLTPVQLLRAFTRVHGLPPFSWAWNRRVNKARLRISLGEPIAQVAFDLGFADQAHLTRRFRTMFGVPPARWTRG